MKFRIVILAFLLIPVMASAQSLTLSAAKDFLPAFQKDDSLLLNTTNLRYNADGTVLLSLASATNSPKIFRYILNHFPNADAEMPTLLALHAANRAILGVVLDKHQSLGEYPVNYLLKSAWAKDDGDLIPTESIMELLLSICLPETGSKDYLPLLFTPLSDADRAKTAVWLISQQQAFDYRELPHLRKLGPDYRIAIQLLTQRLYDLPLSQPIPGFDSRTEALIFAAMLNNDLVEIKKVSEDAETMEFLVSDQSLLSHAVTHADIAVIKYLLSRGVNADWRNDESGESILMSVLTRGDQAVLHAVIPYIRDIDIRNWEGNTPVYFCIDSFFSRKAATENFGHREFYLAALKALRNSGANFNRRNGGFKLPIDLLPENLEDSLARSVAILVLEQTIDQIALDNYAGSFGYSESADMQVLTLLCQKLEDTGSLLYNSNLEKAGLFPAILQESKNLPDSKVYSTLLRSACYRKNVQKVRWLLNDVPLVYAKRNSSFNPDSLRKIIVNSPVAGEGENAIYYFLHQEHTIDWSSKSILKALIAAGANLYQMQTYDQKRPVDLLLSSATYKKGYANEILSGILPEVKLNCDTPSAWETEQATGDLYRKSILAYQRDKSWLNNLKNCISMDLIGPQVSPAPNRRVNITGVGLVSLGRFPVEGCGPIDMFKTAGSPSRHVFSFDTSVGKTDPYRMYSKTLTRKDASSIRVDIQVRGEIAVENIKMSVKGEISIPASKLDINDHVIPPLVIIRNKGDQIVINQNDVPSHLGKNEEKICDRSKGPLKINFDRNATKSDLQIEILGRVQDTDFSDLIVPNSNDVLSRVLLYAEIARLRGLISSNPGRTEEEQIYRKNDEVIIHLLSEYALQRGFPEKVKEEHKQNQAQLADINRLMEPLGQFYQQHSLLDFNNVPQLKKTLQALIDGHQLADQQRKDYRALLQRLDQASQLSELAETYGLLMNSELLQQAERQLDEKNRLNFEANLYMSSGHLELGERK